MTAMQEAPPRPVAPAAPTRPPRLHSLTMLRFFAAVAVVLVHVRFQFTITPALRAADSYGYVGVTFFYLLSGFVLTWSWTGQPASRFWWGRVARIWPLTLLTMLAAFTLLSAQERLPGSLGKAADVLLLQAWIPDRTVYFGGNGVTWSLSCEMFFYLLFPLVIGPVRRLGRRGLAVLAGATVAVLLVAPVLTAGSLPGDLYYWLFYVFPPYRFGEFLLGMVLARAARAGLEVRRPALAGSLALAGVGAVIWAVTRAGLTGGAPPRPLVSLAVIPLFALLVLACVGTERRRARTWLAWRPLVLLGEWSFALFLVHKPVILLTGRWGWWRNAGGLGALAHFVLFLTLATAVAAVAHYTVERPLQRTLRRLPIGAPTRAAAA